jgi:hypothetical protein
MYNRVDLRDEFIEYDTRYETADGWKYFELPNGMCLVLTFIGDKLIPFTTVRRGNSASELKYRALRWQPFTIVYVAEEQQQKPKVDAVQESLLPTEAPLESTHDHP